MSCAMIYWNENYSTFMEVFMEFGAVVDLRALQGKAIGKEKGRRQARLFADIL